LDSDSIPKKLKSTNHGEDAKKMKIFFFVIPLTGHFGPIPGRMMIMKIQSFLRCICKIKIAFKTDSLSVTCFSGKINLILTTLF
jgi:hypothetical protein